MNIYLKKKKNANKHLNEHWKFNKGGVKVISFELNVNGSDLNAVFKKISAIKEEYPNAIIIVNMDCK